MICSLTKDQLHNDSNLDFFFLVHKSNIGFHIDLSDLKSEVAILAMNQWYIYYHAI